MAIVLNRSDRNPVCRRRLLEQAKINRFQLQAREKYLARKQGTYLSEFFMQCLFSVLPTPACFLFLISLDQLRAVYQRALNFFKLFYSASSFIFYFRDQVFRNIWNKTEQKYKGGFMTLISFEIKYFVNRNMYIIMSLIVLSFGKFEISILF